MGTIKIKGYASQEVNADIVDISITFKSKNTKIALALEEVKRQSEIFLKEISLMGVEIASFQLSKDKSYEYNYGENKYKCAERTISINCRFNSSFINSMISVITENKLEAEINTEYFCSNQQEIQNELLNKAIQNSRSKAESLAAANNQIVKYAELISDNKEDCYEKEDYRDIKGGIVCDIILDDESLSNKLSAKLIKHSETVYVTWIVE